MFESLERLILLQIGAAAVTRERVQEAVNRLIEQGRMEREEGRAVVEDVLSRARERSSGTRSLIDASVQQGLRGAGSPEAQVRPEAPPEASVPPEEVEPTIPPVGGVDTAPEPPRDEPDTPPGQPPRT